MTEASANRERRWFQFRLRSLLVAVTIFCIIGGWIGNKARIVRERREMLLSRFKQPDCWGLIFDSQSVNSSGDAVDLRTSIGFVPPEVFSSLTWPPLTTQPPFIEKWLGDNSYGIRMFCIPNSADPTDVAKVTELFPDAVIHRTSDKEMTQILSNQRLTVGQNGLSFTPADREHLAHYYNTRATNRANSSGGAPADRK